MATVSAPRTTLNPTQVQHHIRHPLQSLSGYIRCYVVLEGLALALLFMSLCFWLVLTLDFGLFQLPSMGNALLASLDIRILEFYPVDWIKGLDRYFQDQGLAVGAFWLRLGLLATFILAVLGLVAYVIFRRLFTEFSDRSLALVLERRFPKELGDRLITAVEMAQPGLAQKYGYSQAMVDHTIKGAAERVQQVPVLGVFNWRRLVGQWALALGASLGIWLGAVVIFGIVGVVQAAVAQHQVSTAEDSVDATIRPDLDAGGNWGSLVAGFHRTGSIMVKRNVLLFDKIYWPTRAYVEVVRFQDDPAHPNQMKIGRDEQRPDVRAQAFEWVKYDPKVPDTIRPLTFADLDGWVDAEYLGINLPTNWGGWVMDIDDLSPSVPNSVIPENWQGKTAEQVRRELAKPAVQASLGGPATQRAIQDWLNWKSWTIDRIKLQLERGEVRRRMHQDNYRAYKQWEQLFEKLEEVAANSWTNWDIRKLRLPEVVTVSYRGQQTKANSAYPREAEHRYVIHLTDLKESVQFWVRGDDFVTPSRKIDLVPPPSLTRLVVTKHEPAYIYYRLSGGDQAQAILKGQKQVFFRQPVPLTGSTSRIIVPMGTDLFLTGTTDREYKDGVQITAPEQVGREKADLGAVPRVKVKTRADNKTFSIDLLDVRRKYDFEFRYADRDNVKGRQHIVIEPTDDRSPDEAVTFELAAVLRKPKGLTGPDAKSGLMEAYLITPDALLPFKGAMRDDYGLTRVEWVFEHQLVNVELTKKNEPFSPGQKTTDTQIVPKANDPRLSLIVAGFRFTPLGPLQPVVGPFYFAAVSDALTNIPTTTKAPIVRGTIPVAEFERKMRDLAAKEIPEQQFRKNPKMLTGAAPTPILPRVFSLRPTVDDDNFDVGKYLKNLKVKDPTKEAQHHYRVKLYLEATDNNIEADQPGRTESKLPITFLVVSERELLSQIVSAEEDQRQVLEKVLRKLRNAKTALDEQITKLNSDAQMQFLLFRVEGQGATDDTNVGVLPAVQDASVYTQEVLSEFRRILREMEINKIDQKRRDEVSERIITALEEVTRPTTGYAAVAEEAVSTLREELRNDLVILEKEKDAVKTQKLLKDRLPIHQEHTRLAQQKIDSLITGLERAVDAIGGEIQWGTILTTAVELERSQRRQSEIWYRIWMKKTEGDLRDLEK